MSKTTVIVFAAHHASGNIAAQRFRALLKYLDSQRYEVHVIARKSANAFVNAGPFNVHIAQGSVVGNESSMGNFIGLLSAILLGRSEKSIKYLAKFFAKSWLFSALNMALSIPRNGKCIVIGTYSPVDALVAAWSLSKIGRVPLMLDFRDGFSYESMGRNSKLARFARRILERLLIRDASLVTSVSRPLVSDFSHRYRSARVEILPNGYDPADFPSGKSRADVPLAELERPRKFVISHFGRIGKSDAGRTDSLRCFVDTVNRSEFLRDQLKIEFYGELTTIETAIVGDLLVEHGMNAELARTDALALMRESDLLLLFTGRLAGTATGKIFEYLASMRPIICFTGIMNEATKIMQETSAGEFFLVDAAFENDRLESFVKTHAEVRYSHRESVAMYDRKHQAEMLSAWIDEITA